MLLRAVVPAFFLLSSASAFAADYRVSYALDAGDVQDTGTVTCDDKSWCEFESKKLLLSFTLDLRNPVSRRVTITISGKGDRWGCCYFADGVDRVERHSTESPLRLYIYAGRRRARNEFRINEGYGILYLQFLEMK